MKLNWGTGIAIFLSLFISFILTMVVKAHQVKSDLYAEDYYAQEVNYQETIDSKILGNPFATEFIISQKESKNIEIEYPSWITTTKDAKIEFYRPDNAIFDRTYPFPNQLNSLMVLDGSEFISGNYGIKITWRKNGKLHLIEKEIQL